MLKIVQLYESVAPDLVVKNIDRVLIKDWDQRRSSADIIVLSPDVGVLTYKRIEKSLKGKDLIKVSKSSSEVDLWKDFPGFFFCLSDGFFEANINRLIEVLGNSRELVQGIDRVTRVTKGIEGQIEKLRNVHLQVSRLRTHHFRDLSVISKFTAGLNPGGEFFEVFESRTRIYLLATSTNTYKASSELFTLVEKFSQFSSQNVCEEFAIKIKKIEKETGPKTNIDALLIELNPNSYSFNLVHSQSFHILGDFDQASTTSSQEGWEFVEGRLSRSERLVIFSPGLEANLKKYLSNPSLASQLIDGEKDPQRFIQEVFFRLKSAQNSEYLENDSTCIWMEIGKNAVYQV